MSGFVRKVFGGAPTVSDGALSSVKEDAQEAKSSRVKLLQTEGGVAGQELNPDEISKRRNTLLGN